MFNEPLTYLSVCLQQRCEKTESAIRILSESSACPITSMLLLLGVF